jgi:hypothetical protein
MKNLIIILVAISLMGFTKPCYKVTEIKSSVDAPEMKKERVVFGIRQITEEIMSENFTICEDGKPIIVEIVSIEAPTVGVSLGPFMKVSKDTEVKVKITKDGEDFEGVGRSKTSVSATFIDLNDENLPFNKTSFAGALKKSIEDAVYKM